MLLMRQFIALILMLAIVYATFRAASSVDWPAVWRQVMAAAWR